MATDILLNYNEATVTTTLNNTDVAGTSKSITISAVITTWAALSSIQQMRVMDKADLASTSGYEIMILTANNSGVAGTWTLTRGAESSTIKAHTANWTLIPAITAGGLNSTFSPTLSLYGDGSDGTVTFDGTTTVLGLTPSGSAYTLTSDIYLAAGTINSGVTIKTAGFRIFCTGTLTNNGSISCDGNNGFINVGGAAIAASSFGGTGGAGAGSAATGNGAAASAVSGSLGGGGGHGGSGSAGVGGAGGTATQIASVPRAASNAVNAAILVAGVWTAVNSGAGGGAGAGDGTNFGGSGGGGGGRLGLFSHIIAGTGAIHARGGNGGAASGSTNSGGGGGGGGGFIIIISRSISAGAIAGQTVDANGGATGANGGIGGSGITAGSAGTVILIPE